MQEQKDAAGFTSRLLAGARNLIWQDDPVAKHAPVATPRMEPHGEKADKPSPTTISPRPESTPDNRMTAELMAVVMSRPTAYSSLADSIAALTSIPMDEATRYRSAFAILQKTQQRTVDQIAQAVDVHLSVLESERTRFAGQSKHAEETEVTSRAKEVAELTTANEDADRQIAKLRADTEALVQKIRDDMRGKQERIAELSRTAEQQRQSIARIAYDFAAAADAVKATLLAEKSKVQQYLA